MLKPLNGSAAGNRNSTNEILILSYQNDHRRSEFVFQRCNNNVSDVYCCSNCWESNTSISSPRNIRYNSMNTHFADAK